MKMIFNFLKGLWGRMRVAAATLAGLIALPALLLLLFLLYVLDEFKGKRDVVEEKERAEKVVEEAIAKHMEKENAKDTDSLVAAYNERTGNGTATGGRSGTTI